MLEWTWDPEDFAALWYSDANDRFPRPLKYLSRFAFQNDFARHRLTVRGRYPAGELERIELALHTLSTSEMRIEILGGTRKHKDSTGDVKQYRIVGARNRFSAVVAFQTVRAEVNGPIRLRAVSTESLAAHIVRSIPACRPGLEPPATFHPGDLRADQGTYLRDNARNTPRERYRRLLHRPADGGGSAGLRVGPLHSRPEAVETLQWWDISGDGRYTESTGQNITVRPTTPAELGATFTGWLDRAERRLRDAEAEREEWV
ncbi:ESX secretion-associated protein EspG [Nocardia puris]|uniref:ESAT-6 protein secretion system EspG family protein n=1 Tax=Nocardia puris TaxID=208602 RepID=A0A366DBH4_9NOCA|nr:ESX secretion-associated protein EspG [Nocardia puris]MBF6211705.1 ESX secretion-associated protein EspG [Nocardia puris]MBF6365709.1 ESX secretion-associated protein EspG [Nocardia puris]MBF6460649.1 ESX secretion-associated protein EspG [Nocardia puris]RBO86879.1 ESAT-6 protein secretion system EspG family protein [Nocardia puris]